LDSTLQLEQDIDAKDANAVTVEAAPGAYA
jgi:hypothetical protein